MQEGREDWPQEVEPQQAAADAAGRSDNDLGAASDHECADPGPRDANVSVVVLHRSARDAHDNIGATTGPAQLGQWPGGPHAQAVGNSPHGYGSVSLRPAHASTDPI